ncbi:hypothetical protein [Novosphingobium sp. 11B]
MTKLPGGTTTMSGQSRQSEKAAPRRMEGKAGILAFGPSAAETIVAVTPKASISESLDIMD